ncbi:MAG TPA: hypothetical protein VEW03_07845, partial [Longimicrobiaceae bacterium]|nr:hypothetical protein [Longimicrobiaceae bacterium]
SGNSAAATALLRLGELTGEERYTAVAVRVLEQGGELAARLPAGFGELLCALDFHLGPRREVAFAGDPGGADTRALVRTVSRAFLPNTVLALRRPEEGDEVAELIPLLRGRSAPGGRATAYVCERFACRRPVTDPAELAAQLGL